MSNSRIGSPFTINALNYLDTANFNEKLVFVDVDEKPARVNIQREGKLVPSVKPNKERIAEALGGLNITRPTSKPRVFDQSIEAGTRVAAGTTVDLILAPRNDVKLGIFTDVHIATVDTNIGDLVEKLEENRELTNLVLKYDKVDDISDAEQSRLAELFTKTIDIPIDNSAAGQNIEAAFNTARAALAFK